MDALRRLQSGLSLIELMLGLFVLGILLALAVPSMREQILRVRLDSAKSELMHAMIAARELGLHGQGWATVCSGFDGTTCRGGGWSAGWVVFVDANNNRVLDAGEPVLGHRDSLPSDVMAFGNRTVAEYVRFGRNGHAYLHNGGFQAGTITLCAPGLSTDNARLLILAKSGRVREMKTHLQGCTSGM
ncbi:MAG: GspH/FimT family pseudopilin [Halothiobacillaceae bacterium]|jgi:type IV fimbrial biogenesis protein FimT|nr:GspH/FimT family pseudopilin [Halothiobacillaceae bacterium]MDY0050328.1 GspH/FimT family pseudopilin [Halothiobacillaceae bacterium]